jgi:membrane associated rhomboid family serine protease
VTPAAAGGDAVDTLSPVNLRADEPKADPADWHCYRHPERESGVRCRRCERPICPECMITAPVGFQCPSCVKGAPKVRSLTSLQRDPHVTWTIIAVNVAVFVLAMSRPDIRNDFALFGPAVADGEWWRLFTGGFLHAQFPLHLGFNMLVLYQLGSMLEPQLGRARFLALYAVGLLGGALGALLLSPDVMTVGASGAVYGLLGATVAIMRRRGIDVMQSGLGGLLLVNLFLTFVIPGISVGGHLGGLVAGAAAGGLLEATEGNDHGWRAAGLAACCVAAVALLGVSLWVATSYAT